jgi:class 3 adenylate cyclase
VLFADLSGFSALAEHLAERGPRGAEDLKSLLNLFFGRLVDLVHAHGGQVVDFPGDAVLALWPAVDDGSIEARHATRCGLEAQEALAGLEPRDANALKLRVGIGLGGVWAANVGGVADRWHLLVAGDALTQAVHALKSAKSGEVIVSATAWASLAAYATAQRVTAQAVRVAAVTAPAPALSPSPSHAALDTNDDTLRRYVPSSIQARIDAGQTDWLAEFRRLSVLFVDIGPLDSTVPDALDRLQRATVIVQGAVEHYGGSVCHLVADDKGTVIDCGWGLALHAHADDAVRAARAAIDIRRQLAAIGVAVSCGLATGDVFTGLRGTSERCDFAMIGSVVNLAAALMQASRGDIVCDAGFCEATGQWGYFEPLSSVPLKGRDRAIGLSPPGRGANGAVRDDWAVARTASTRRAPRAPGHRRLQQRRGCRGRRRHRQEPAARVGGGPRGCTRRQGRGRPR